MCGDSNVHEKKFLDTSDGFILRDAVEEMRNNGENGAD